MTKQTKASVNNGAHNPFPQLILNVLDVFLRNLDIHEFYFAAFFDIES